MVLGHLCTASAELEDSSVSVRSVKIRGLALKATPRCPPPNSTFGSAGQCVHEFSLDVSLLSIINPEPGQAWAEMMRVSLDVDVTEGPAGESAVPLLLLLMLLLLLLQHKTWPAPMLKLLFYLPPLPNCDAKRHGRTVATETLPPAGTADRVRKQPSAFEVCVSGGVAGAGAECRPLLGPADPLPPIAVADPGACLSCRAHSKTPRSRKNSSVTIPPQ